MRFSLLYSWIFVLIKFVKRCICGRKKIKDEDDSTKLPTSVSIQQSASKQEEELASWDDWGNNDSGLISIKVESANGPSEPQQPEEMDLFGDMQPIFQKPKKIRLKTRAPEVSNSHKPSERLKFDSFSSVPEPELGAWNEEPDAWDEVPDQQEIEWETQNLIKEKRQAERERRAQEQQKRKEERDAARLSKKAAANLGVKIS